MDDATAGADSMERLEALSGDGGHGQEGRLRVQGDPDVRDKEDENGEPRKVLGLIWETEADRLKVDVKLNLRAKKAGLHLMENIELNEGPEKRFQKSSRNESCGGWRKASTIRWGCCALSPSASRS